MISKTIKKAFICAFSLLTTFGSIQCLSSHDVEAMNSPVALIDESTINKGYSAKAEEYELNDYDKIVVLMTCKCTSEGAYFSLKEPPVVQNYYCDYDVVQTAGKLPYIDFMYSMTSKDSIDNICKDEYTDFVMMLEGVDYEYESFWFNVSTKMLYKNAIVVDIDEDDIPYYYLMQKRNNFTEVDLFFTDIPKNDIAIGYYDIEGNPIFLDAVHTVNSEHNGNADSMCLLNEKGCLSEAYGAHFYVDQILTSKYENLVLFKLYDMKTTWEHASFSAIRYVAKEREEVTPIFKDVKYKNFNQFLAANPTYDGDTFLSYAQLFVNSEHGYVCSKETLSKDDMPYILNGSTITINENLGAIILGDSLNEMFSHAGVTIADTDALSYNSTNDCLDIESEGITGITFTDSEAKFDIIITGSDWILEGPYKDILYMPGKNGYLRERLPLAPVTFQIGTIGGYSKSKQNYGYFFIPAGEKTLAQYLVIKDGYLNGYNTFFLAKDVSLSISNAITMSIKLHNDGSGYYRLPYGFYFVAIVEDDNGYYKEHTSAEPCSMDRNVTIDGIELPSIWNYKKSFTVSCYVCFGENLTKRVLVETDTYCLNDLFKGSTTAHIQKLQALCDAKNEMENHTAATPSTILNWDNAKTKSDEARKYTISNVGSLGVKFSHIDMKLGDAVNFTAAISGLSEGKTVTVKEYVGGELVKTSSNVTVNDDGFAYYETSSIYYANFSDVHTIELTYDGSVTSTLKLNGYEYIYLGLCKTNDAYVKNVLTALYEFASACAAAVA